MRTSLRRIALMTAAVIAVGAPQWPCPVPPKRDGMAAAGMEAGTATAVGAGLVGASRLASHSVSVRPITAATMAAHTMPMGAIASCAAAG